MLGFRRSCQLFSVFYLSTCQPILGSDHRLLLLSLLLLTAPALAQQPSQNYALFFAVDTYDSTNAYPPLLSPVEEARSLARVLEHEYGFQAEVVENPTARQTEEKLAEYAARFADGTCAPEDQLLVVFSGRGLEQYSHGYFLTRDTRPTEVHRTALSFFLARVLIDNIACQHILVAVDAPYSRYFDPQPGATPENLQSLEAGEQMFQQHQATQSRLFLTSGDSLGLTPDQSGFTERLKEALAQSGGADSTLTFSELCGLLGQGGPDIHRGSFGKHEAGGNFLLIRNIAAADSLAWQRALRADNCAAAQSYLTDYTAGKYREAAAQQVETKCGQTDSTQVEANAPIGNTYDKDMLVYFERDPDIDAFMFAELKPQAINYDEVRALMGEPVKGILKREEHKGKNIRVVARVLVDKYGNYKRHRLISMGHPICSRQVEAYLHRLIFTPAIQGGKPVSFWVNMAFTFQVE
ncbi:MAG: caspase family protein [Bacteroidia bacterium]|nr:caspase family protein [Bacteroidia bacterium]